VDNSPDTLLENAQNKCSVIFRESDVSSNENSMEEAEIKEANEDESHDIIVDPIETDNLLFQRYKSVEYCV